MLVLLVFLTFSVFVANPKKMFYTVANPARGLLNREKRTKRESLAAQPPLPYTLLATNSRSMIFVTFVSCVR